MTSSFDSTSDAPTEAATHSDLLAEIAQLKLDLWAARDAAIAASASAGAERARAEALQAELHRYRVEVGRLANLEQSITYRVGKTALTPVQAIRRLSR